MNEFESRINALRLQFKAERMRIQKDANLTIGHLNTAIGQVSTIEAREALRAEKARVYEATRQSMKYNRLCYRQQVELLNEQHREHLRAHPSKRAVRQAMALMALYAADAGKDEISIALGDNRRGTVSFI